MQAGISFAVGQLLAVVAPRTVLVVDAPTDWSLAGPLWELALDDAPVDEILDVLIRRGIRTAPSFAIVRVENDAVRALVRGSVPVCFERAGEPVRLDATGATSWLEGLISGAKRVLVGKVDASTPMPYLVSTGVVLVSGLALPCETPVRDEPLLNLDDSRVPDAGRAPGSGNAPELPAALPVVPAGDAPSAPSPVPAGTGPSGRVVDLTRSPGRPAPRPFAPDDSRENWPVADQRSERVQEREQEALNGHAPSVLAEPAPPEVKVTPEAEAEAEAEPEVQVTPEVQVIPGAGSFEGSRRDQDAFAPADTPPSFVASPFADPSFVAPSFDALVAAPPATAPADADDAIDRAETDVHDEVDPGAEPDLVPAVADSSDLLVGAEPEGPSPADLPNFDPPSLSLPLPGPSRYQAPAPVSRYQPPATDSPSTGLGAPAAWPPIFPGERVNGSAPVQPAAMPQPGYRNPLAAPDARDHRIYEPPPVPAPAADQPSADELPVAASARLADEQLPAPVNGAAVLDEPAAPELAASELAASELADEDDLVYLADLQAEPALESADAGDEPEPDVAAHDEQALRDLPFRVRGQSLRPEQREPLRSPAQPNGFTPVGSPLIPSPEGIPSPLRPVMPGVPAAAGTASAVSATPAPPPPAPMSGSLLLPAFFRGARAARSKPPAAAAAPAAPVAREGARPSPVPDGPSRPQTPSNWSPPMRHVFPDRSAGPGGPAGPGVASGGSAAPIIPGVMRSGGFPGRGNDSNGSGPMPGAPGMPGQAGGPESRGADPGQQLILPPGGPSVPEPPREPPRLLGVWCDAGHVTSPDRPECRVCGLPVPPQAPILVARPPLGVLVFDNGDRVVVDQPVILGRDPKPVSSPDPEPPVLHPVTSATGQVSRTHAEVRASGWDVVLTDLEAMNGTALTVPGASPVAIEPGVPTVLTSGSRVDLGGESGFAFEIEG